MNSDRAAGATWFKSSRSNGQRECVEVAFLGDGEVAMRDSKQRGHGPIMTVNSAQWRTFITGTTNGQFDQPTA